MNPLSGNESSPCHYPVSCPIWPVHGPISAPGTKHPLPLQWRANPATRHKVMWFKNLLIYSFTKPFTLSPDERSEEHTSELQSRENLVCRLLLEKKKI